MGGPGDGRAAGEWAPACWVSVGAANLTPMGQPVTVIEKQSSTGPLRFEINRSITGMGHEHYRSVDDASGTRPVDNIARTLLEQGGVEGVHINSNVITVDVTRGTDTSSFKALIEDMFTFYRPGVEVPSFDTDD